MWPAPRESPRNAEDVRGSRVEIGEGFGQDRRSRARSPRCLSRIARSSGFALALPGLPKPGEVRCYGAAERFVGRYYHHVFGGHRARGSVRVRNGPGGHEGRISEAEQEIIAADSEREGVVGASFGERIVTPSTCGLLVKSRLRLRLQPDEPRAIFDVNREFRIHPSGRIDERAYDGEVEIELAQGRGREPQHRPQGNRERAGHQRRSAMRSAPPRVPGAVGVRDDELGHEATGGAGGVVTARVDARPEPGEGRLHPKAAQKTRDAATSAMSSEVTARRRVVPLLGTSGMGAQLTSIRTPQARLG